MVNLNPPLSTHSFAYSNTNNYVPGIQQVLNQCEMNES
jgi:hypothetical protein